ncbi:MAG: NAD(P)H-quinone oxidoreductase [Afipia sp.]|nr:NAD(P)H-quinone oxidoreductase [Afipia sp.]
MFDQFGEADVLRLAEAPVPEVRPTDLLVRVRAASLNRADLNFRRGSYGRPNFGDSTLMGLEIAGEVIETGSDTSGFKVGDRVMGIVGGGAYAEVARIDYRMAIPIPAEFNFVQAAAIPEVFVTAHEALFHLAGLQKREAVLIHAAAGGVGSAAVQLAHASGARVIATTTAGKLDRVCAIGADHAVDYKTLDFVETVMKVTDGRGTDVVIDFIGAPYLERNIRSLGEGGRLIQVGIMGGGADAKLPLDLLLFRYIRIIGTVMKSRTQEEKQAMTRRFQVRWLDHLKNGDIKPLIDSTFPLARAADAHRRMEGTEVFGKIVLEVA